MKIRKKPWITKEILTKIREENKTYEKYLKSKGFFWYIRCINSRNTEKAKGATIEPTSKKILNNQKIFGIQLITYLRIKANS